MSAISEASRAPTGAEMQQWAAAINKALEKFSDKDWNYSRIRLKVLDFKEIRGVYVLRIDWLDVTGKLGRKLYKESTDEMTWGNRHSHELGILELISLRLNRALLEVTSDDFWNGIRPVLRLQKREELLAGGWENAFWYEVEEVQGEEFENR